MNADDPSICHACQQPLARVEDGYYFTLVVDADGVQHRMHGLCAQQARMRITKRRIVERRAA